MIGMSFASSYKDSSRAVRDALDQAGFRISDIVPMGGTVLIKPNLVMHGGECLITNLEFLRAVVDEVRRANPTSIKIGDAPLQGCDWDAVVPQAYRESLGVEFVDFRRTIRADGVTRQSNRKDSEYVRFDLGTASALEPVSDGGFRVTMYDPRELEATHAPGKHQYLIAREVFDAEVVISVPKLKTHCKAGITGAMKNLVGMNGSKEFLPHHRAGAPATGGDCYPNASVYKTVAEWMLDAANRRIGKPLEARLRAAAHMALRFSNDRQVEGAWHGNDTCWRMVEDLNRIAFFGRPDGTIAPRKQRTIWTITDAIEIGEGDGPLRCTPRHLGVVTFSSHSTRKADVLHAHLLGINPNRLPSLRDVGPVAVRLRDTEMEAGAAGILNGISAALPEGWQC